MIRTLQRYRVTITVSALALLACASEGLSTWFQLDFAAVAEGQWWRIWTGHLTHYDAQHLFWDLLMFIVLGAMCEREHRRYFPLALGIMTAGISAVIGAWCDVTVYRGLSGLDTGLFVWFVADQCRQSWLSGDRIATALWLTPAVGLLGKLLYEAATGQTLFVDSSDFTPLVESHLAGVGIGLLISWALVVADREPVIAGECRRSLRRS